MKQALITVSMVLILVGCQTYQQKLEEQNMKKLSGAELQSMLGSNYSIRFETQHSSGTAQYKSGGSAIGEWNGSDHEGIWYVEGDAYCTKWDGSSKANCYQLYEQSDGVFTAVNTDGSYKGEFTRQ